MMRSEHLIIIVCLLLIYKLATRVTGAALPTPPDDDEPRTQTPLPFSETAYIKHLGDSIQHAAKGA